MGISCTAKIKNNSSKTTVIKTLAKFTDWEGNEEYDPPNGKPGEVSIEPGQAGFRYARTERCWKDVWMFIVTETDGSFDDTNTTPEGYCRFRAIFELNESNIAKKDGGRAYILTADGTNDLLQTDGLSDQGKAFLRNE